MKTIRVHLEELRNETWFIYLTTLIALLKANEAVKTLFAPLLVLLEKLLAEATVSMEMIQSSQFTKQLDDADVQRDRIINGFNNYVRAFEYDPDTEKATAAGNLLRIISHYSAMAQAPQDEESGMIINFLDELAANHAADVEVLELSGRIAQLKAANTQFIDLLSKRRTETATKPARRMVEIRREGNGLIRMLYAQIDLLQRTSPTADITAFANEINAENARVNANLRRG